jgi:hypothetical protein
LHGNRGRGGQFEVGRFGKDELGLVALQCYSVISHSSR